MRRKPFSEIRGISDEIKQAIIDYNGRPPDNFVESAEAGYTDLPDLDTNPDAVRALEVLQRAAREPSAGIFAVAAVAESDATASAD